MVRSSRLLRSRQWVRINRDVDQLHDFVTVYARNHAGLGNFARTPRVLYNICIPQEHRLTIRPATIIQVVQADSSQTDQSVPVITIDDDPEVITLD